MPLSGMGPLVCGQEKQFLQPIDSTDTSNSQYRTAVSEVWFHQSSIHFLYSNNGQMLLDNETSLIHMKLFSSLLKFARSKD